MAAKLSQKITPNVGPSYSFTFGLEENFDWPGSVDFFNDKWHVPFFFAIAFYLPCLYVGQKIMHNREPLKLKIPMMLWNSGLAIFSIIGFIRVAPEFFYILSTKGFQHSVCSNSWNHSKQCRFWIYLFVLSKTPELGDTFFLVLRKQKLIFLHVYHHATVLLFSWFIYANQIGAARWFCTMNFGVHAVMYSYYVLKAMPNLIKIPKWVSMFITASQTLQMVIGAYVVASAYYVHLSGQQCDTSTIMSLSGLVIYVSYLFLFSNFFIKAYLSPRPPRDNKSTAVADKKRA